MLAGNFFKIEQSEISSGHISAAIQLNPEHPVYEGHFPGMPVVPGVCQVQMVKEILCSSWEGAFLLTDSKMCKFINMMNPKEVTGLKCDISWSETPGGEISFSGELADAERTYLKIKGILKNVNKPQKHENTKLDDG